MKTNPDCLRHAAITDARAIDDEVSDDDARFAEAHLVGCAACRREVAMFDALAGYGDDEAATHVEDEAPASRRRRSDPASAPTPPPGETPSAPAHPSTRPLTQRPRMRVPLAFALPVAAAAATTLWLVGQSAPTQAPGSGTAAAVSSPVVGVARVVLAEGAAVDAVDPESESPGDGARFSLPSGRLCLRIDADVAACIGEPADATRAHPHEKGAPPSGPASGPTVARLVLAASGERAIVLEQGAITVDVTPGAGRGFVVRTPHGDVVVVGTVFSVHVADASARVGVEHGRVRVARGASTDEVATGETLAFGGGATQRAPYATVDVERDAERIRGVHLSPREGVDARLVVRGAPECTATLDRVAVGAAPLWIRVAPAAHDLVLGGACDRQSKVDLAPGKVERVDALPEGASGSRERTGPDGAASAHPASAHPAAGPADGEDRSPAALLSRAQDLRRRGDAAAALAVYEELTVRHPASPEAQAARISVGRAKLAAGNASAALGEFDRYLARGGALTQEAEAGRIDCLRALGRAADEADAIRSFLSRHPDAIQAETLRARLVELGR